VPHNQQANSWITFKEKDVVEVPLEKGTAAMEKLAPLLTTASVFVVMTAAKILMSVCHWSFAE
jgi:hypothetical protein